MSTPKNVILFRPATTKTSSTFVEDKTEKPVYTMQQLENIALRILRITVRCCLVIRLAIRIKVQSLSGYFAQWNI